jgi:hypothetical protein
MAGWRKVIFTKPLLHYQQGYSHEYCRWITTSFCIHHDLFATASCFNFCRILAIYFIDTSSAIVDKGTPGGISDGLRYHRIISDIDGLLSNIAFLKYMESDYAFLTER